VRWEKKPLTEALGVPDYVKAKAAEIASNLPNATFEWMNCVARDVFMTRSSSFPTATKPTAWRFGTSLCSSASAPETSVGEELLFLRCAARMFISAS
jgi:hypothetical protein